MQVATNSVHHTPTAASHVVLPVEVLT
jgi:hypothetical protein